GDVGRFIFNLPVVITCTLVASRIVSMTFVPLLGHALLREHKVPLAQWAHRRERGVAGFYARGVRWAIDHRYAVLLAAVAVLAAGVAAGPRLKTAFFPKDLSYLSYVDIWLPENATLEATDEAARTADRIVRDVAAEFGTKKHREVLQSVTTFIGGGAPRFWFSLALLAILEAEVGGIEQRPRAVVHHGPSGSRDQALLDGFVGLLAQRSVQRA